MNLNYNDILEKAYSLHQKNDLINAEKLYKHLVTLQPEDSNVLNLLGLLYIAKKEEKEAIKYLSKAFILKKDAYVASNLAKAYYFNKEYEKAIKFFNDALSIKPSEDIYYSLALAYKKNNDYVNTLVNYKKALELNPNNYMTYYNLALTFQSNNEFDKALECAEKSAELNDTDEEVYTLLSGYYERKKDYLNAIKALEKATSINPKNHLYFYNLGVLYTKVKKKNEAKIAYNTCIMLNNLYVEAYVNIANLYKPKDLKLALAYLEKAYSIKQNEENLCLNLAQTYRNLYDNEKSIDILNKYLDVNPNSSEAYSQLAINYMDNGDYSIALELYNKALKISPKNKNYLHGKAVALKYLDDIENAKKILEDIVSEKQVETQTIITLGMMYLSEKQFGKGMNLYRQRSNESKFRQVFKSNIWSPEIDITGKKILVYSDCGLGDTIMYARFLPLLYEKVSQVTLQTDKELVKILSSNFPQISVISKRDEKPDYDYVMPMMDIQYALNLDFDNIPSTIKYLSVEKSNKLDGSDKKIGLFWQGNKRVFKNRSININFLKPLLNIKNANFYSFQIEKDVEIPNGIINLKKQIKDYNDTASLLMDLDVLITIDSSIAHMAGALGVRTFLLLPKTAEWRWFNDSDSCSWYKSIKIFKQVENGNWEEVILRVLQELKKL